MSPTQKRRFAPPAQGPRKRTRSVEVRPLAGIHTGFPPQDLPPGYAAAAQNFVSAPERPGWMTPRSGLSKFGTYDFNGPVLGAAEIHDIEGNSCGFAPSRISFSFLHPDNVGWSDLSYVPGNQSWHQGNISGTSTDYFDTVSIFDQNIEAFIAVTSNNTDSVKFFEVESGATEFSDFTFADSIDSVSLAKTVAAVNDRLVFANVESSTGTRFPTRLVWSARGNPRSFLIDDEGGAEDIMDMRGEIQRIVRFRDFLVIFTEHEVWRGTPTLDAFAFRFDRVVDSIGCRYPKTIAVTPNGVIFLGRDREVYVTDGASVAPLGPVGGDGPSRVQRFLQDEATNLVRAWSIYNQTKHRYEMYFPATDSPGGYPGRALFFDFTGRTWWPQKFAYGLTSGIDLNDPTTFTTYDDVTDSYDDVSLQYDDYDVETGNRGVNVFSSDGSTFRFRSAQTNDSGSTIDARWRSGGFGATSFRQVHLTEIWTDYEATSNSSMSVFVGAAGDPDVFSDPKEISLTTPQGVIFHPTWKTGRAPNFEVRLADGGQPRIASFSVTLKDGSKF